MVDFQERDTRRGVGDRADRLGGSGSGGAEPDDGHDDDEHGDVDDGHDDHDGHGGDGDGHGHDEHGGDEGHDHDEHGGDEGHDHDDHDHHAHDVETLDVAVVTVSSSRTPDSDPSGDAIEEALADAGHGVAARELVPDSYDRVQDVVDALVGRGDVDAVVTTGGTGVTPDDVTVEAVEPLFEKWLPGFGELFRRRSEDQIGTRVVATRAVGGIVDGVPVFCLPGSEAAVRLGVSEIILPEAGHLAGLARRDGEE